VRSGKIKKITPLAGRREFLRLGAAFLLGVPVLPSITYGSWLFPPDLDDAGPTTKGKILPKDSHGNPEEEDLVAGPKPPGHLFLTFDDGPLECTASILDQLAAKKQKTTFFVIGRNLTNASLRKLAIRAIREGHELGNHSYTHPSFSTLTSQQAAQEILKTHKQIQQVVKDSGGNPRKQNRFFRFPMGEAGSDQNHSTTKKVLAELGYRVAWWDVDPRDWQMRAGLRSRPTSHVIASVNKAESRDIVLLHDRTRTAAILSSVLGALQSRNLVSLPLSAYDSNGEADKKIRSVDIGKRASRSPGAGKQNSPAATTLDSKGWLDEDPADLDAMWPGAFGSADFQ